MPVSVVQRHAEPPPQSRWLPWIVLVCGGLLLAGIWLHEPNLGIAAVSLLLLLWLPRVWRRRSVSMTLLWLALAALILVPASLGHPQLSLTALPVVCLSFVAWLFARTLRRGEEPLVARCIRLIEGEARLALPGVRAYARGVTWYWSCVPAVLALVSLLLLFARPDGWLATFGVSAPIALPGRLMEWFPEAGCWALLALAFVGEYAFRRWHLRGIPHPSMRRFVTEMARCWPQLIRGGGGPA